MKLGYLGLSLYVLLLSGCDTGTETTARQQTTDPLSVDSPALGSDIQALLPVDAPTLSPKLQGLLATDAPALGTRIQTLADSQATLPVVNGYQQIAWENLELPGQGLKDIVKKYQDQIDAIPEGDPAELAVMDEMQAELNTAPVNPAMNGQKIRLPGFVAPLEIDEAARVRDFLLVPYYGACIHLPPPPISQTILVEPRKGDSIGLERVHEPVWVSGIITTQHTKTDLAYAGYQIKEAAIDMYLDVDNETN